MDLKTFVNTWHSDKEISYHPTIFEWMEDTFSDPQGFWSEFFEWHQKEDFLPIKSVPFRSYDFYHDAILRHIESGAIAFQTLTKEEEEFWTYKAIDQRINKELPHWKEKKGKVAIVLPYGIEYILALMLSLRLGLSIQLLPPNDPHLGPQALLSKLRSWNPDFIVTLPTLKESLPEEWDILTLEKEANETAREEIPSYSYESGQLFFDTLEVDFSFLSSLRDGLLTLNLKQGTTWTRPFSSMILEEPSSTLTALLAGATIVHLPDPTENSLYETINVLGVSPTLQKRWIQSPPPLKNLKLWYKNPQYGNPYDWMTFAQQAHLEKTPYSNLYTDPKKGGMILFSKPKPFDGTNECLPSLGVPWELSGQQKNAGPFLLKGIDKNLPTLHLAQFGNQWVVTGGTLPIQKDHFYPLETVESLINSLDFVDSCMIYPEKHPKDLVNQEISLLVFHSPKLKQKESWEKEISAVIKESLGEGFLPENFYFFPLFPKKEGNQIHRSWTSAQYQSGLLEEKKVDSISHHLNLLRDSLYNKGGPLK